MSLFSSSFAPSSSVVSGSSNPFTTASPSSQEKKRKRPRESDATSSKPARSSLGGSSGGNNASKNAYEKRNEVASAQANLEKLMKKVGMVGGESKGKGLTPTKKTNSKRKSVSKRTEGGESDIDPEILNGGSDDETFSAFPEETDQDTPQKKRKMKHGLDGRPVGPGANKLKVDPLAALLGGKKKKEKKPETPSSKPTKPIQAVSTPKKPTPAATSTSTPTATAIPAQSSSTPAPEDRIERSVSPVEVDPQPLTSLQNSLTSKLSGAKFRWLNEQLYTNPSGVAVDLMRGEGGRAFEDVSTGSLSKGAEDENPDGIPSGNQYHSAHRTQTSAWPSPPLPYILKSITSHLSSSNNLGPFVIDLGCGDAQLARDLMSSSQGRARNVKVASFDLVGNIEWVERKKKVEGGEGWVIPGDFLSSIPLPGNPGGISDSVAQEEKTAVQVQGKKRNRKGKKGQDEDLSPVGPEIVDMAVCCLSLMGINWVGGVYEICRVLKEG
jgi:ribosomal RNA-processing protein 8